jgi:hypothetical protein
VTRACWASYLGAVALIHLLFVITGRRMDEILFPTAALLAGISLLLMQRLPQDLAGQGIFGRELSLGPLQLAWVLLGFASSRLSPSLSAATAGCGATSTPGPRSGSACCCSSSCSARSPAARA